jgi:hypothetical protein
VDSDVSVVDQNDDTLCVVGAADAKAISPPPSRMLVVSTLLKANVSHMLSQRFNIQTQG